MAKEEKKHKFSTKAEIKKLRKQLADLDPVLDEDEYNRTLDQLNKLQDSRNKDSENRRNNLKTVGEILLKGAGIAIAGYIGGKACYMDLSGQPTNSRFANFIQQHTWKNNM